MSCKFVEKIEDTKPYTETGRKVMLKLENMTLYVLKVDTVSEQSCIERASLLRQSVLGV